MAANDTLKLLILHESQDDAEQLLNRIRNSGMATRAELIQSDEHVEDLLQKNAWDLLLLRPEVNDVHGLNCLKQVKKRRLDLPALLLIDALDEDEIVEGLEMGYQAVIPKDNEDWVLQAIRREHGNLLDRRQRRLLEVNFREAEKRCDSLLETSRDAITYVIDGMHIHANLAYVEMFGYEEVEDLDGMPILDMVAPADLDNFKKFFKAYSSGEAKGDELICNSLASDGSEIESKMIFSKATYDSEPCIQIMIRGNMADAELQEKLKEISSQDLLTGLLNRQRFTEILNGYVDKAVKEQAVSSILYMQIDKFDDVQTQVGISGADMVLTDIASLLREQCDETLIARFSDDTFTLILDGQTEEAATATAEKLRKAIESHLSDINDRTVQATVSIGIALIAEAAGDSQELLTRSHKACEIAQNANGEKSGNSIHVYEPERPEFGESAEANLALINEALETDGFKVLFQPIIDLRGSSGELYEVLLRLINPDSGTTIEAKEFLNDGLDKETCKKIDRWVIIQAIKRLSAHREAGNDTRLMINITGESLADQTLLPWIRVTLQASRIPGDAIVFQFSETNATTFLKQAKEFTQGLAELHCQVAISRFGCSLNPFNNLKHINASYLKLDSSYIKDLGIEESKEQMKEMIETAHGQGRLTIAPCVENPSILSSLWQTGVNYIQGYYLQEPVEQMTYDFTDDN